MIAYGAALSLDGMFAGNSSWYMPKHYLELLENPELRTHLQASADGPLFFESKEEHRAFNERHQLPEFTPYVPQKGETVHAYLGIDSGSTTTKFVLMDEDENLLDSFYAPNEGDPLTIAKTALLTIHDRYEKAGAKLDIIAAGTTGYGELLFSKAFSTECHVVETVAHARAADKYIKDATFILDIGGQDMKAIWIDNGIITNIVVNEACSSGCGSFLENFASSLHIPVEEIAEAAFSSKHPASLGSRCTVFMNSSIVTEQRNGKQSADIMAGLCRSIIENVFTKVIRISNLDSLGDKIVVQAVHSEMMPYFVPLSSTPVVKSSVPLIPALWVPSALLSLLRNALNRITQPKHLSVLTVWLIFPIHKKPTPLAHSVPTIVNEPLSVFPTAIPG